MSKPDQADSARSGGAVEVDDLKAMCCIAAAVSSPRPCEHECCQRGAHSFDGHQRRGYSGRDTHELVAWHIPLGVALFGLATLQLARIRS